MSAVSEGKTDNQGRTVVLVDDDAAVRDSTTLLLQQAGHTVHAFESGDSLVAAGVPVGADMILLDIMMPGLSGLETLRILSQEVKLPPVVVLTGHGDIPLAVEAMKLGAVEFLEKPYPMQELMELVDTLEKRPVTSGHEAEQRASARAKLSSLSPRQREVLKGIALGEPSKVTAHKLSLSTRTVETYRGHVFERLAVRGMAEAVRVAILGGLLDE